MWLQWMVVVRKGREWRVLHFYGLRESAKRVAMGSRKVRKDATLDAATTPPAVVKPPAVVTSIRSTTADALLSHGHSSATSCFLCTNLATLRHVVAPLFLIEFV